jgi:hypothetical protein
MRVSKFRLTILATKDLKNGNFEKIYENRRDTCNMPRKPSNFVQKATLEAVKRCSNFVVQCPYKKVKSFNLNQY